MAWTMVYTMSVQHERRLEGRTGGGTLVSRIIRRGYTTHQRRFAQNGWMVRLDAYRIPTQTASTTNPHQRIQQKD